ncbi:MAG: SRPBCC family protein [Jatrophihabitantaceae bacterium]
MVSKLLLTVASAATLLVARRAVRDWGATKSECGSVLPGDDLGPDPTTVLTRAVTVKAPSEEVWRWLVQLGENRGGSYGYQKLEDVLGIDVPHADCVKPRWQHLVEGDQVVLVGPGRFGGPDAVAHSVITVVPQRTIVLVSDERNEVRSFHIRLQGPDTCRLVSRRRSARSRGWERIVAELFEPVDLLATRQLLLGIKAHAEASVRRNGAVPMIAAALEGR